jgi:hypothetical protein
MKRDNNKIVPEVLRKPGDTVPKTTVETVLDEQKAMHLTRSFWLAFNSINMYGDMHPQAKRAVEAFHAQLLYIFPQQPRVLFHVDRGGFFCGTWRVDREMRILRLLERLSDCGIDSITFEPSVSVKGLGLFVILLVDTKLFRSASDIEGALRAADVFGIRINRHKYGSQQVITDMETPTPELDLTQESPPDLVVSPPPPASGKSEPSAPWTSSDEDGEKNGGGEDGSNMEIYLTPGQLDLGEIGGSGVDSQKVEQTPLPGQPMMSWEEMKTRMEQEIGAYRGGNDSTARFDRFYENLESMLLRFLLDSASSSEEPLDLDRLRKKTEDTDWKLLNELENSLRDHHLLEEVGSRLQDRFVNRVALVWADTVWQQYQPLGEADLPAFFSRVEADLSTSSEAQVFLQSLLYLLDERGLPDSQFARIWERLVRKGSGEEKKEPLSLSRLKLPREIETRREIIRDLETEMYRHNRYTSPFSCLSISLFGVRSEPKGKIRSYTDDELNALFGFLGHELQASLRKLDRFGSLGPLRTNHLLILLPMTDVTGAVVLMERLENRAETWKIVSPDGFFNPVLLFSSLTYNADKIKDVKGLLRKIRSKHRKKSDYMSKNVLYT